MDVEDSANFYSYFGDEIDQIVERGKQPGGSKNNSAKLFFMWIRCTCH